MTLNFLPDHDIPHNSSYDVLYVHRTKSNTFSEWMKLVGESHSIGNFPKGSPRDLHMPQATTASGFAAVRCSRCGMMKRQANIENTRRMSLCLNCFRQTRLVTVEQGIGESPTSTPSDFSDEEHYGDD
jgi:hypothetical protein